MGFSEAVQWWEEWQLRLLALASLFIQCFLFVAAPMRKRHIPSVLRFLIWIAFLGSDAVAAYALATLFNRHKNSEWVSTHRSSANLEALWAPILLLHLAGQDSITAYNIEDNELWRRHVVTGLSQISVAIYVFRKSWSGDTKLLQAAILVFVPGIIKCLEKPWALKLASINSIVKIGDARISKTYEDEEKTETDIKSLEDFVREAAKCMPLGDPRPKFFTTENLFVELSVPYNARLRELKRWVNGTRAHRKLRRALSKMFDRLYTWYNARRSHITGTNSRWKKCLVICKSSRGMAVYLLFGAIALFHKSHRSEGAYKDTDAKITYILLCCTTALEYSAIAIKPIFELYEIITSGRPWPDLVSQYSLIGYLVRNKKHGMVGGLASRLGCKDLLDHELWCMAPCKSSSDITMLVHDHVMEGWNNYITDVPSYHRFNDSRGQWTLQRNQCDGKNIKSSLGRPFDESVLLWHLATDLCFYHQLTSRTCTVNASRLSREISNYMAYLLFVNPNMLVPGARPSLFTDAYKQLEGMPLDDGEAPQKNTPLRKENLAWQIIQKLKKNTPLRKEELAKQIINKLKKDPEAPEGSDFIHDAWALARELMEIRKLEDGEAGGEEMWKVIQGVWVEMLCFSAARCRGYLHAKSMCRGGEYLTYVWLLLLSMGMEPLAERTQRTETEDQVWHRLHRRRTF